MARVAFTGNLKRHVTCPTTHVEGTTVGAVLENLFTGNPRLRSYVVDDQGRLRKHVNIYINDARAGLGDPVGPDAEIFVFQALSGG